MKRLTALTLIALMGTLSACETMEGLGRDTQKAGAGLEKTAQKADGNSNDDHVAPGDTSN